jgi:Sec-independent protein translocase protein TatA
MLPNSEWILLALLAVVLLKPEDIPTIAKFLAKVIRQMQHLWNDVVLSEIDRHTNVSENSNEPLKKHPFHISPPGAKSQPVKD